MQKETKRRKRMTIRMLERDYERDALSYLTIDGLCDFSTCPLLFYERWRNAGIHKEANKKNAFLRNAHLFIMYGREAVEARLESIDKEAIGEQLQTLISMTNSINNCPEAQNILHARGMALCVMRNTYFEIPCQIWLDWLVLSEGLAELKICDNVTDFNKLPQQKKQRYAQQMAFYKDMVFRNSKTWYTTQIIAIEKNPPYICKVWQVPDSMVKTAQAINRKALRLLSNYLKNNYWPCKCGSLRKHLKQRKEAQEDILEQNIFL